MINGRAPIQFLKRENKFLLIFGIGIIIFLGDLFFLKNTFIMGDYKRQFFPWCMEYANAVKHFTLPFWNTYMGCGFPLAAEGQIGPFYPLNIIMFFFLPPITAYSYGIILHFILGGVFMYIFSKRIGLNDISAIMPSILFMFASPYGGCFLNIASLKTLCWFPLVLYIIFDSLDRDRPAMLIFSGIIMGFQLLAGAPQMAFYSIIFSCLYFFFFLFYIVKSHAKRVRYVSTFILSGFIALIIYSPQLIISNVLLSLSNRSTRNLNFALARSFFPAGILTLVFPHTATIFESMIYIGLLPLILAVTGIYDIKKNRQILFFAALFLISMACALGRFNPLYILLLKMTNFYMFRIPSKFLFFSAFSLIILSGYGLQYILSNDARKERAKKMIMAGSSLSVIVMSTVVLANIFLSIYEKPILSLAKRFVIRYIYDPSWHNHPVQYYLDKALALYKDAVNSVNLYNHHIYMQFFILALCVVLLILYGKKVLKKSIFIKLSVIIVFFDLLIFSLIGTGFRGNIGAVSDVIKKPEEVDLLRKDNSLFRVYLFQADESTDALQSNLNIYFGIDNIGVYSPLVFRRYFKLLKELGCVDDSTGILAPSEKQLYKNLTLLGMLNIKYIISQKGLGNENLLFLKNIEDGKKLYLNKLFMPRAFIVYKTKTIERDGDVLAFVKSDNFNPQNEAVVEENVPGAITKTTGLEAPHEATITTYTDQLIIIKTKSSSDGILVLSDYFYPGWHCYLDGKDARIFKVNYILRATRLPKGEHEVKFKFSQSIYRAENLKL